MTLSGPRLMAFASLLMGMFRQIKRRVSMFCEMRLHHSVSVGLVVKHQQQASDAERVRASNWSN